MASSSFNKVILIGNLTRDPELRYLASGTAVCNCAIAINYHSKNKDGEWQTEVTYVEVTFWQKNAEIITEYCKKGSPLFIEGHLRQENWEKDGVKHSKLCVVVGYFQMMSKDPASKTGGRKPHDEKPVRHEEFDEVPANNIPEDDIPF